MWSYIKRYLPIIVWVIIKMMAGSQPASAQEKSIFDLLRFYAKKTVEITERAIPA